MRQFVSGVSSVSGVASGVSSRGISSSSTGVSAAGDGDANGEGSATSGDVAGDGDSSPAAPHATNSGRSNANNRTAILRLQIIVSPLPMLTPMKGMIHEAT